MLKERVACAFTCILVLLTLTACGGGGESSTSSAESSPLPSVVFDASELVAFERSVASASFSIENSDGSESSEFFTISFETLDNESDIDLILYNLSDDELYDQMENGSCYFPHNAVSGNHHYLIYFVTPAVDSDKIVSVKITATSETMTISKVINVRIKAFDELESLSIFDADLQHCIEETANRCGFSDIGIRYLSCGGFGGQSISDADAIASLEGIETLSLLERITIDSDVITDISPISNNTNLSIVQLTTPQLTDYTPITELSEVTELHLWDIAAGVDPNTIIANLTNLQYVYLQGSSATFSELNSLANRPELSDVGVNVNSLTDVSFLANLPNLQSVDICSSSLTHLPSINGPVRSLRLCDYGVDSLDPIAAITSLVYFEYQKYTTNDVDLSILSNMSSLYSAYIYGPGANATFHLPDWSNMQDLVYLTINNAKINDISGMNNLSQLQKLDLTNNQITDVSPLASLNELKELWLMNNELTDISPLQNLTETKKLGLTCNEIVDISPLTDLLQLETLTLDSEDISTAQIDAFEAIHGSGVVQTSSEIGCP